MFMRVPKAGKNTFTLQIQALEFQLQFPNLTGVPVIARNDDDAGRATPLFSYNDAQYIAWPQTDYLDAMATCMAQMVGLLQFGVGPRHPQKLGGIKWANWGFPQESEGKFATTLYSHDVPPAPHIVWVTGTGFRFADQGDGAAHSKYVPAQFQAAQHRKQSVHAPPAQPVPSSPAQLLLPVQAAVAASERPAAVQLLPPPGDERLKCCCGETFQNLSTLRKHHNGIGGKQPRDPIHPCTAGCAL